MPYSKTHHVSAVTSKKQLFETVFNSFHFLIIATKNSILDVAGVLDATLITDIFVLLHLNQFWLHLEIGQSIPMAKKMAGCYKMGLC